MKAATCRTHPTENIEKPMKIDRPGTQVCHICYQRNWHETRNLNSICNRLHALQIEFVLLRWFMTHAPIQLYRRVKLHYDHTQKITSRVYKLNITYIRLPNLVKKSATHRYRVHHGPICTHWQLASCECTHMKGPVLASANMKGPRFNLIKH